MKRSSSPTQGWSSTVYKNSLDNATRGPADPLPTIPPAALAPLAPEGTIDGMLLTSVKDDIVNITVTTNAEVLPLDEYTLFVDGVAHGGTITIPADIVPASVTLPLAVDVRTEGPHTLQYKIHSTIGNNDFDSAIVPLSVDLTKAGAPEQLPRPEEFDSRILTDGLTLDLLTDLGDVVTAHLAAYGGSLPNSGMASGDRITPYIGTNASAVVIVSADDLSTDKIQMTYEKQAILAAGDGTHNFYYTVTDRAGNVSDPSYAQPIQVVVTSGIDDLLAPVIAAFDDDDIILEAEARAGVHVTIPAHVDVKKGMLVIVTWGTRVLAQALVGADNTAFDVIVPVKDVYAQSPDTTPFDVSYEVRTSANVHLGTSPATEVAANLETAGGVDPDPETPWNENLKPITIQGGVDDDGDGSPDAPNVISVEDSKVDATAVIPWTAIDDTTVVFKEGDIITVTWAGTALTTTRTITAADVTAAVAIEMKVPTAAIQAGGSGDIVATYSIARPVTAVPDYNTALSPDQIVDVKSATGLPGGVGPLTAVVLPEARTTGTPPNIIYLLNKAESTGGTVAEIPHYLNKKAGDKITLTYAATDKIVGGADIPASHFDPPVYIVPAEEIGSSSSITIPEANLLAVTLQGNGKVNFSVENDIGSKVGPTTTAYLDNR